MAMAIQTLGGQAISFTGAQVGIVTDSTHTKARIRSISTARMRRALNEGQIVIVAGFQGIDEHLNITTLGRGGSDTTAVALAAVMKHSDGGARGEGRGASEGEGVRSEGRAVSEDKDNEPCPSDHPPSLAPRPSPLAPV